jgi:tellurite resistance protein
MKKPLSEVALRGRELLDDRNVEAFLSVLVEAAYLVAAADGLVSETERQTLAETISAIVGGDLPPEELVAMLVAFGDALNTDGLDQRLTVMAEALADAAARENAVSFAALVALCDREFDPRERVMLLRIGAAFHFDEARVGALVDRVASSLRGES